MRKLILVPLILVLSTHLFAQSNSSFELPVAVKGLKWKLTSVGLKATVFSEKTNLGYRDVLSLMKDPSDLQLSMDGFTKDSYFSSELSGEFIGLNVGFAKPISKNLFQEFQVGANVVTYSEYMLDYVREDNPDGAYETLSFCHMQNRFNIDAAYQIRAFAGNFSVAAGPFVSFGTTFNDALLMFGGSDQLGGNGESTYELKSTKTVRAQLGVELGYTVMSNLNLSLGGKYGTAFIISPNNDDSHGRAFGITLGMSYSLFGKKFADFR